MQEQGKKKLKLQKFQIQINYQNQKSLEGLFAKEMKMYMKIKKMGK